MPGDSRARWGWHQLADAAIRRLVAGAGIRPGDLVLDVGAGKGAITARLVDVGARVIAVELHPQRVQALRDRFDGAPVTVVRADASDLRLPRQPFLVVANPPFGITMALVRRLLAPGSRMVRADLVVPRHVARRWSDERAPGRPRWGATFDARRGTTVPRAAFHPAPRADAVVLRLERHHTRT